MSVKATKSPMVGRWRSILGCSALLGLAVLGVVSPAGAGATSLMVGGLGERSNPQHGNAFVASRYMGAQYARLIFEVTNWSSIDWSKVDEFVADANNNGLKPYLTLTASPNYSPTNQRVPSAATYAAACKTAATRYNGQVGDFAVWNEPNLTGVGNLDPAMYALLYKECRAAIKGVNPADNVYFGELSTAASGWGGMNACEYFDAATPIGAGTVTEGVSIHPYQFTTSPTTATSTHCEGIGRLGDWQAELANAKNLGAVKTANGGQAPLLVSEFGYCAERPPLPPGSPPNSAQVACPQDQSGTSDTEPDSTRASWVKQAFEWAKTNGVAIFNYHTVLERPASNYTGNLGGLLWESGIVNDDSGAWLSPVKALREAVNPPAPSAVTGGATEIRATQATLNGTINPNRTDTSFRFEYGPTTSYGSSAPIPAQAVGFGSSPLPESTTITGLVPGVTYHYRIVATYPENGISEGADQTFTTSHDEPSDVNGDGKGDLVECNNNEYVPALSTGTLLASSSSWSNWGCSSLARLGDFTGDGKADVIVPGGNNTWAVGVSNGSSFNGPGTQTWLTGSTNSPAWDGVGDVNGDGKADFATCSENAYSVALSTGSQLSGSGVWSNWGCSPLARLGDFTGDGKADLIAPGGSNMWAVGVSNGSSFNGPGTQMWLTGWTNSPAWDGVGDVNGDGKADFVTCTPGVGYSVALSNGSQLSSAGVWSTWGCSPNTRLIDVNGDGKADLVVPGVNGTWVVGISNGSSFNGTGTQAWLWSLNNEPTWVE